MQGYLVQSFHSTSRSWLGLTRYGADEFLPCGILGNEESCFFWLIWLFVGTSEAGRKPWDGMRVRRLIESYLSTTSLSGEIYQIHPSRNHWHPWIWTDADADVRDLMSQSRDSRTSNLDFFLIDCWNSVVCTCLFPFFTCTYEILLGRFVIELAAQ